MKFFNLMFLVLLGFAGCSTLHTQRNPAAEPAGVESKTLSKNNVCHRTPRIRDTIVAQTQKKCDQINAQDLAKITEIFLNDNNFSSLKGGDFNGLTSVTSLTVSGNFKSTPKNLFHDLVSLKGLEILTDDLSAIPDDFLLSVPSLDTLRFRGDKGFLSQKVFSHLKILDTFILSGVDKLDDLPFGYFEALSSLKTLSLQGISGTPSKDVFTGLNKLKFILLEGSFPTLPTDFFSDLKVLESVSLQFDAKFNCSKGMFEGSNGLKEISFEDIRGNMRQISSNCFRGLTGLEKLGIRAYEGNLTELPEDVFQGLSSLQTLDLFDNNLASLPAGIFQDLSSLQYLSLDNNDLVALPSGIFRNLKSLVEVDMMQNKITDVSPHVFDQDNFSPTAKVGLGYMPEGHDTTWNMIVKQLGSRLN